MKTSLRSDTAIDLFISPNSSDAPFTGSDHLPVFAKFHQVDVNGDYVLVPKPRWSIYSAVLEVVQEQIDGDRKSTDADVGTTSDWFGELQSVLHALKCRVTVWQALKRRRPSLSSAARAMLRRKHYFQNRYRHIRLESDRLRLRSWCKSVRHKFASLRQERWHSFISDVTSPNSTKFWQTVKTVNKKLPALARMIKRLPVSHMNTLVQGLQPTILSGALASRVKTSENCLS